MLIGSLELLSFLVLLSGRVLGSNLIKSRGRPLDRLTLKDVAFVSFNKLTTTLFTYHLLRFCWLSPRIHWALEEASFVSTVVAGVAL